MTGKSIFRSAHAGIRFQRNLAQQPQHRRSPVAPQFIPNQVANLGGKYRDQNNSQQAQVAQAGDRARCNHERRHQQRKSDPLQQGRQKEP